MNRSQQIKDILIKLAIDDKLPSDLNDLDRSIFDKVFNGAVFPGSLKDQYVNLVVPKGTRTIQVKLDDEGVVIDAFNTKSEEPIASTWRTYQMMEDGDE